MQTGAKIMSNIHLTQLDKKLELCCFFLFFCLFVFFIFFLCAVGVLPYYYHRYKRQMGLETPMRSRD